MYSDAEALGQAAKTKGGLQDPTEADMLIGMSQAAQGKYAEAAQTFSAINQPNPASARVVRLWTYFAKQKANPGTGATAAAK
jgi:cytochrome c-type biogenesis protein CcmH/NrfG